MGVVQCLHTPRQVVPPDPKSAGIMSGTKVTIQNDPIHAIVATREQILVKCAQTICFPKLWLRLIPWRILSGSGSTQFPRPPNLPGRPQEFGACSRGQLACESSDRRTLPAIGNEEPRKLPPPVHKSPISNSNPISHFPRSHHSDPTPACHPKRQGKATNTRGFVLKSRNS